MTKSKDLSSYRVIHRMRPNIKIFYEHPWIQFCNIVQISSEMYDILETNTI